ncbi:MAG: putative metal-dependent hydrolase [Chloroflexi bacterium]|nr:putative metal-dependent hydrolase [Chloroflexota bacterium]
MHTPVERQQMISQIRQLPATLTAAVASLNSAQLDASSAPGEWTARQIVHHLADSHMNGFIRMKLMLTEEHPPLKPYNQEAWAASPDVTAADIRSSLAILEGLHSRWCALMESLQEVDWRRTAFHPERGVVTLDDQLTIYARHGNDHLAQISRALAKP